MSRFAKSFLVLLLIGIGTFLLLKKRERLRTEIIDYTAFIKSAGEQRIIGRVTLAGHEARYLIKSPSSPELLEARTSLPDPLDPEMFKELRHAGVAVFIEKSLFDGVWGNLIISLFPFALITALWCFMLRQPARAATNHDTFDPMKRLRNVERAVESLLKQRLPVSPLESSRVQSLFESCGALRSGHFLLTSGLHSPQYLEKFNVLQHPELTTQLCAEIARRFHDDNVQVVVGPATGGIILAHEVGRQLGASPERSRGVRAIFTEREGGLMTLRRGFQIAEGERVLVVEDIVTTGGSIREVVDLVNHLGGELVGVALLCDRSNGQLDLGVRTEALMTLAVAAYPPEDCPQCKNGEPITERGSRHL